jgi:hypothetical protein
VPPAAQVSPTAGRGRTRTAPPTAARVEPEVVEAGAELGHGLGRGARAAASDADPDLHCPLLPRSVRPSNAGSVACARWRPALRAPRGSDRHRHEVGDQMTAAESRAGAAGVRASVPGAPRARRAIGWSVFFWTGLADVWCWA